MKLHKLMKFKLETQRTTYEEGDWTEGLANLIQEVVDDAHVSIQFVAPSSIILSLTKLGAEKLLDYIGFDNDTSGISLIPYKLQAKRNTNHENDEEYQLYQEEPEGEPFGYLIRFRKESTWDVELDDSLNRVLSNFENVTVLERPIPDSEFKDGIIIYEMSFVVKIINNEVSIFTTNPMFTQALHTIHASSKTVVDVIAKYVSYILTYDLVAHIDGYEEDSSD